MPSNKPHLYIDVDDTLFKNGNLNTELLKAIEALGYTEINFATASEFGRTNGKGERDLEKGIRNYEEDNTTRYRVKRDIENKHPSLSVRNIIITSSSFAEAHDKQGDYYRNEVEEVEKSAMEHHERHYQGLTRERIANLPSEKRLDLSKYKKRIQKQSEMIERHHGWTDLMRISIAEITGKSLEMLYSDFKKDLDGLKGHIERNEIDQAKQKITIQKDAIQKELEKLKERKEELCEQLKSVNRLSQEGGQQKLQLDIKIGALNDAIKFLKNDKLKFLKKIEKALGKNDLDENDTKKLNEKISKKINTITQDIEAKKLSVSQLASSRNDQIHRRDTEEQNDAAEKPSAFFQGVLHLDFPLEYDDGKEIMLRHIMRGLGDAENMIMFDDREGVIRMVDAMNSAPRKMNNDQKQVTYYEQFKNRMHSVHVTMSVNEFDWEKKQDKAYYMRQIIRGFTPEQLKELLNEKLPGNLQAKQDLLVFIDIAKNNNNPAIMELAQKFTLALINPCDGKNVYELAELISKLEQNEQTEAIINLFKAIVALTFDENQNAHNNEAASHLAWAWHQNQSSDNQVLIPAISAVLQENYKKLFKLGAEANDLSTLQIAEQSHKEWIEKGNDKQTAIRRLAHLYTQTANNDDMPEVNLTEVSFETLITGLFHCQDEDYRLSKDPQKNGEEKNIANHLQNLQRNLSDQLNQRLVGNDNNQIPTWEALTISGNVFTMQDDRLHPLHGVWNQVSNFLRSAKTLADSQVTTPGFFSDTVKDVCNEADKIILRKLVAMFLLAKLQPDMSNNLIVRMKNLAEQLSLSDEKAAFMRTFDETIATLTVDLIKIQSNNPQEVNGLLTSYFPEDKPFDFYALFALMNAFGKSRDKFIGTAIETTWSQMITTQINKLDELEDNVVQESWENFLRSLTVFPELQEKKAPLRICLDAYLSSVANADNAAKKLAMKRVSYIMSLLKNTGVESIEVSRKLLVDELNICDSEPARRLFFTALFKAFSADKNSASDETLNSLSDWILNIDDLLCCLDAGSIPNIDLLKTNMLKKALDLEPNIDNPQANKPLAAIFPDSDAIDPSKLDQNVLYIAALAVKLQTPLLENPTAEAVNLRLQQVMHLARLLRSVRVDVQQNEGEDYSVAEKRIRKEKYAGIWELQKKAFQETISHIGLEQQETIFAEYNNAATNRYRMENEKTAFLDVKQQGEKNLNSHGRSEQLKPDILTAMTRMIQFAYCSDDRADSDEVNLQALKDQVSDRKWNNTVSSLFKKAILAILLPIIGTAVSVFFAHKRDMRAGFTESLVEAGVERQGAAAQPNGYQRVE